MPTTNNEGVTVQTQSLSGLHWIGILAALVTAGIHLLLGIRMVPSGMGISFLLAGLGFLGAIVLILIASHRRAVYAVGIPFILSQIVLWFVINFANGPKSFPADIGTLGTIDKIAQLVLLGVIIQLLRS